eukprot:COSAG01_NODE_171_length_23132_cov_53.865118_5_plen_85_part_00
MDAVHAAHCRLLSLTCGRFADHAAQVGFLMGTMPAAAAVATATVAMAAVRRVVIVTVVMAATATLCNASPKASMCVSMCIVWVR